VSGTKKPSQPTTNTSYKSEDFDNAIQTQRPETKNVELSTGWNASNFFGLDVLNKMIEDFFTPEENKAKIWNAVCLHEGIAGLGDDFKVKVRARIPQLHSHLPLPRSANDFDVIELYPIYVAESIQSIGGAMPKPGQIIEVEHSNNKLMFMGYGSAKIRKLTGDNMSFLAGQEEPNAQFKACFENYPPTGVAEPSGQPVETQDAKKVLEKAIELNWAAQNGGDTLPTDPEEATALKLRKYNAQTDAQKKALRAQAVQVLNKTSSDGPNTIAGAVTRLMTPPKFSQRKYEGTPCSKIFKLGEIIQGDRKLSEAGMHLLHKLEGKKSKPYQDSAGWWTVGIGSLIDRRKPSGKKRFEVYKKLASAAGHSAAKIEAYQAPLTDAQINNMAKADYKKFEDTVNRQFKGVGLTQRQFEALVSFSYNAGSVKNPLRDAVKANPNDAAIGRYWVNQTVTTNNGTVYNKGLVSRRKKELDHYFGKI